MLTAWARRKKGKSGSANRSRTVWGRGRRGEPRLLLYYNITVLIHEMYEHGIDPGIPGTGMPPPPQAGRTAKVPPVLLIPLPGVSPPLALPGRTDPPVIQN